MTTSTYAKDPRVDAYIDAFPAWQQAICREVRDLVHAADPEVDRDDQADRAAVLRPERQHRGPARDQGPRQRLPVRPAHRTDPEGIITAGHDNQTGRQISVHEGERINAPALTAMFRRDRRARPGRGLEEAAMTVGGADVRGSSGEGSAGEIVTPSGRDLRRGPPPLERGARPATGA